ncbi:MAG: hypothetical protein Q9177_001353 [Variospora cf. flavescens]
MAPYLPLYILRSDGKAEVLVKSRKKESNIPTEDQLNSRPDAKGNVDYFKELEAGDAKEVDWRRKLGGMLIGELYERVKSTAAGSETTGNTMLQIPTL